MAGSLRGWKQLSRKTVYSTPYLTVYSDSVEVKPGSIVDDFSVLKLSDGVMIVATDEQGKIVVFHEYKYAPDQTFLAFPAGSIDEGESIVEAAARELREETGYESTELEYLGALHVYPSKIIHQSHIVRAKNARKVTEVHHEETETIGDVVLLDPKDIASMQEAGEFNTTYLLACLALTHPEYLLRR